MIVPAQHTSARRCAAIVALCAGLNACGSGGATDTGPNGSVAVSAVPSTLNWDLWLGGASMRPYATEYTPYNWRGFFDFGTGQLGNWGIHTMGPVQLAMQLGAPTSVEVIKMEGKSKISLPSRAVLKFEFPARGGMPPVAIYWHDSARPIDPEAYHVPGMDLEAILPRANNLVEKGRGNAPRNPQGPGGPPPQARPAGAPRMGAGGAGVPVYGPAPMPPQPGILSSNGAVFVGSKGIMTTVERGEGVQLLPAERWNEFTLPPQLLTRSPGHMADWVRSCKGGEASCSNFSISSPYAEWMTLGVIAYRVGGKLLWDSKNMRFTNSPEANKYIKPTFRKGWDLTL